VGLFVVLDVLVDPLVDSHQHALGDQVIDVVTQDWSGPRLAIAAAN
jgi:hypothetical protein